MTTKPLKGFKLTTDKSGRQTIVKKPAHQSLSGKIRQAKSQKTKVVRRLP